MKNILIINIDSRERSVYSALMASVLSEMNQWLKITMITTKKNDVMNSIALFDKVHFLDDEVFFEKIKNLSEESTIREIKSFLMPVLNTDWEHIINLSADPLAAIFAAYLKAEEVWGPVYDSQLTHINHNNIYSLILNAPYSNNTYPSHISSMYFGLVEYFNETNPLPLVWKKETEELTKRIDALKVKTNFKKVVAIDASIKDKDSLPTLHFIINLYKQLHSENKYLPILFCDDVEGYSYVIDQLRGILAGEIYVLSTANITQLSSMSSVDLIITNDLYVKSMADIVKKPSILLIQNDFIPYSDFGMIPKSHLIQFKSYNNELAEVVSCVYGRILENPNIEISQYHDMSVFETILSNQIPILTMVTGGDSLRSEVETFVRWRLHLKIFYKLTQIELATDQVKMHKFQTIIQEERQKAKTHFDRTIKELSSRDPSEPVDSKILKLLESDDGLMNMMVKIAKNNCNDQVLTNELFLETANNIYIEMMDFFANEELGVNLPISFT